MSGSGDGRRRGLRVWWRRVRRGSRHGENDPLACRWVWADDPEWGLAREIADALRDRDRGAVSLGLVVAAMIVAAVIGCALL